MLGLERLLRSRASPRTGGFDLLGESCNRGRRIARAHARLAAPALSSIGRGSRPALGAREQQGDAVARAALPPRPLACLTSSPAVFAIANSSSNPRTRKSTFRPTCRRELAARLVAGWSGARAKHAAPRRRRRRAGSRPLMAPCIGRSPIATGTSTARSATRREVQVVVNDGGSIIFGRCSCPFFDTNLMSKAPASIYWHCF